MTNNEIITDREKMLEAVKNDGYNLVYADDTLKADREVVLEAVKSWGTALFDASEELQNDPEIKKIAEGQSKKNQLKTSLTHQTEFGERIIF